MSDDKALDHTDDPTWIFHVPDDDHIAPPVETREQELPFGKLSWQNFERLCHRLARADGDIERCRLYGTQGQEQGGIDIYVSRKSTPKYAVWQSKRHKTFSASQVESAVTEFLDGSWASKSDRFVLCVQASLRSTDIDEKIEKCRAGLRDIGIQFEPLDGEELSLRLKELPEIIDDFFGREWALRFCGPDAAQTLAERLRPIEIEKLRASLRDCYTSHFATVDPGVLSRLPTSSGGKISVQLADRYVAPDFWLSRDVVPPSQEAEAPPRTTDPRTGAETPMAGTARLEPQLRQERERVSLEIWLSDTNRDVVLGPAGSGKSTLLRYLALDMLSAEPKLVGLRRLRADFIPVWVSFPFWTKLIATGGTPSSLIDAIEAWFKRQDEPDLVALVRKALDDKRLLLLVDGIDEWENETAAGTALTLLQAFAERRSIPVIISSRPHGYRLMGGLDGSWRVSDIAPLTVGQQIDLATAWFRYLDGSPSEASGSQSRRQAADFVAELQGNGAIAQLGGTPLLLTGLIALRLAHLRLPRNRFLAYAELTKLLLETHPVSRDRAALAGSPRHELDNFTRETALAALAYAIQAGEESSSQDAIESDRAAHVVSQSLTQQVGLSAQEARQTARSLVTLGEEEIGILVRKSPREIGFFHRIFQGYLAAHHLARLSFDEQVEFVKARSADPRWHEVVLCLLYQLQRPNEIDRLIAIIDEMHGGPEALMMRDLMLAEIAFGEFKRTPGLAKRLAEDTFDRIETSKWLPPIRHALVSHAIEGLSSTVLAQRVSEKLTEWFPRWHSYSLVDAFAAIAEWPKDDRIAPVLWRGLHDEFYEASRAAAVALATRYGCQPEYGKRLCALVSAPPSFNAAAAGIEALWRGWPDLPELHEILDRGRRSAHPLIGLAATLGRIHRKVHGDDDFAYVTKIGDRDDYQFNGLVAQALLSGWSGDARLKAYATSQGPDTHGLRPHRSRPNYSLLINGFPDDEEVAALVARDFSLQYPHCAHEGGEMAALAKNFKGNATVVSAMEAWASKQEPDDAYTFAGIAHVASTPLLKSLLLKSLDNPQSLGFWAASALIDIWGADDPEVLAALSKASALPVSRRQDIAHVLPLVMDDKQQCRELLLEIVDAGDKVRADFALQGLGQLGIDASDTAAADRVFARGYDGERFVLENEVTAVLKHFSGDPRAVALAERQLRRDWGPVATVADVFASNADMRRKVLAVVAPLDVDMRSSVVRQISRRGVQDPSCRSLITAARFEEKGQIAVEASMVLARINKQIDQVSEEYLDEVRHELNAIGPRLDERRQAAFATSVIIGRLDLLDNADASFGVRRVGPRTHNEVLRLVATEWPVLAAHFGGDDQALAALKINPPELFGIFPSYVEGAPEFKALALRIVEEKFQNGAPAGALRFIERARPGTGYLRELCIKSFGYDGPTNWGSYSAALTAGEILGRNFAGDQQTETELLARLGASPRSPGVIAAICEGWPNTSTFEALRSQLGQSPRLGIALHYKVASIASSADTLTDALAWGATELVGDLWEANSYWIPNIIRRIQCDDEMCAAMQGRLSGQASPGVKASFPRLLGRARGVSDELRAWCISECERAKTDLVGEVGLDLVAGQARLVTLSLFDLLAGRES